MMMSRAVQQLMWFELLFQTQGHLLPSWTEWICGTQEQPTATFVSPATPKDELPPALCRASATREGP